MQLLRIESIPIKFEIKTEPARLEMKDAVTKPEVTMQQQAAKLDIHTRNIKVQLNTYEMRKQSFNMRNTRDFALETANKGRQNQQEYVQDTISFGREVGQIQDGVTIGQLMRQKVLEQPSYYTMFLPNGGTEISWIPNSITKDYTPSEIDFEANLPHRQLSYVPGSFAINILQYPEVNIEYLGTPTYVPPSADPNYTAPEG